MRFEQYLQEEYITTAKSTSWKNSEEIFVNPSNDEIRQVGENSSQNICRYLIDFEKKKLYIWASNIIHEDVVKQLYKEDLLPYGSLEGGGRWKKGGGRLFDMYSFGYAKINGNKLVVYGGFEGAYYVCYKNRPWLKQDDSWLSRWFDKPYIKAFTDKIIMPLKREDIDDGDYKSDSVTPAAEKVKFKRKN
jgi:hypothetical protein